MNEIRIGAGETFPAALAELADTFPDTEAVVAPEGRVTFAEFHSRCAEFAGMLARAGLRPGQRVGVLLPNGLRWLVAMLGAQRAGLTVVPINTWYRSNELAHLIATAQLRLIVTDGVVFGKDIPAELAAAGRPGMYTSDTDGGGEGYLGALLWPADEQLPTSAQRGPCPPPTCASSDPAMILYTSGSTALPKPVPLEHGKLLRNGRAMGDCMHVVPGDRLWFAMPLFFGYGACNALPVALAHGLTLCVQEKVDGDAALAFIEAERCTVFYGLATAVRALLAAPSFGRRDISSLRTGPVGFNAEDKRLAIEGLDIAEACSAYGMTESYGFVTMTDAHDDLAAKLGTQGKCLPTQAIRITDSTGRPCPPGSVGEIEIRGCVIPGYLGGAEINAGTRTADDWFRTGDLGVIDDEGRLAFGGRWKEMLKIKGINVAPLEVEEIVSGHASVDQAYVLGIETADGDQEMACVVVPAVAIGDAEALSRTLTEYIRARAASYKVPARFVVMEATAVPQTATGKVSKLKLRELLSEGVR
ncbi:class I adenylate-forming enzyme family protein [Nocardia vermiculata]|uniref:Acyl--CoA ligase n=1 Tax=Nocardia vermiculata TaxID=257274 RepID=A0A846Y0C0_9NOCA|nr:class I adenylate-forming enzyme family protein [Nocardia vermiculata]NKY51545.1 acyl--CoA ligase [Nocardia vermiculata]